MDSREQTHTGFDRRAEGAKACRKAAATLRQGIRRTRRTAAEGARLTAEEAVGIARSHCDRGADTALRLLRADSLDQAAAICRRRAVTAPRRCLREARDLGRVSAKGALATLREMNRGLGKALDAIGDMRVL